MSGKTSYLIDLTVMLVVLISAAPVCFAQSASQADSDARDQDSWQDWQLTLTTKKLNHFLDYPSSAIGSLTVVSVQCAQPVNSRKKPPRQYECLYYTGERVIGSKLSEELEITPGTAGIIKVGPANPEDSYAIANAVLRLYLDVALNRCMTKYVLVPGNLFPLITDAICRQGFHRGNQGGSTPSQLSLRVISDLDQSTQILRMP